MNARIADLIREGRADEITDAVADGEFFDIQTFTQALIDLVLSGAVDGETAANAATNRHDFLVSLEQAQKRKRHADATEAENARTSEEPVAAAGSGGGLQLQPPGGGLRVVPAG